MESSYAYLAENFNMLIHGLTIGQGNIKERLSENSEWLHKVFGLDFPPHLQNQKDQIIKKLTKFPAITEDGEIIVSSYKRTIMKVRYKTLVEIVKMIDVLYFDLNEYFNRGNIRNYR